ncbi:MAG: hypothetical protein M1826_002727 [Phylliscum demangeonii]|nr:MAG: hypothetical protein M1826_002727 [Phylliscum demangeonii]
MPNLDAVALMVRTARITRGEPRAGQLMKIKASTGIRLLEQCLRLIGAGADRIGTSTLAGTEVGVWADVGFPVGTHLTAAKVA